MESDEQSPRCWLEEGMKLPTHLPVTKTFSSLMEWTIIVTNEAYLGTHTSSRIRVAIADSNLAQAEVVARSLSQDALAVGVDAAKWESQVEAFERVLRDLKRVDYVYASKYIPYIYHIYRGLLGISIHP